MDHVDPATWSACLRLNKDFNKFLDQKVEREKEDIAVLARKGLNWHLWKLYSREDLKSEIRLLAGYGLYSLVRVLGTEKDSDDILYGASKACHLEMAKWIFELGAMDRDRVLMWACSGGHMKMVEWAVDIGADGWNWALMGACIGGKMKMARWAVEKGAREWNWAIKVACYRGQIEMIKWLVEMGATKCDYCKKSLETHL
jgi:hypothetical protein